VAIDVYLSVMRPAEVGDCGSECNPGLSILVVLWNQVYCGHNGIKCSESTKSLWNIRSARAMTRVQTRHLPNHLNRILRRALNSVDFWCQDQNPQGTFNTLVTTVGRMTQC
jgi:hypothetical protein